MQKNPFDLSGAQGERERLLEEKKREYIKLVESGEFGAAQHYEDRNAHIVFDVSLEPDLKKMAVQKGYAHLLQTGRTLRDVGGRPYGFLPAWNEEPLLSAARDAIHSALRADQGSRLMSILTFDEYLGAPVGIFLTLKDEMQQFYKRQLSGSDPIMAVEFCIRIGIMIHVLPEYQGELNGAVMNIYDRLLRANDREGYHRVRWRTMAAPDLEKLKEACVVALSKCIEKEDWASFDYWREEMGLPPDFAILARPELLQLAKKMLAQTRLDGLVKLRNETGFFLDFAGKRGTLLQQAYAQWMKDPERLERLKKEIVPTLGIEPDFEGSLRDVMPGIYAALLQQPQNKPEKVRLKRTAGRAFERGRGAADEEDRHPEERKKMTFGELLGTRMTPFERLHQWSPVDPDWKGSFYDTAKKISAGYLREQRVVELAKLWDAAVDIRERLLKEPEILSAIHDGYNAAIRNGRMKTIDGIQEVTGMTPRWENHRAALQQLYKRWLHRGDLPGVLRVEGLSGVKPDYAAAGDVIQKRYAKWLANLQYDKIDEMEAKTGVAPDGERLKEAITNGIVFYIQNERFADVKKISDRFHIPLNDPLLWRDKFTSGYYRYNKDWQEGQIIEMTEVFTDRPDALAGMAAAAKEAFFRLLYEKQFALVSVLIKRLHVYPKINEILNIIWREIGEGALSPDLIQICMQCHVRLELSVEQARDIDVTPRILAFLIRLWLPKDAKQKQAVLEELLKKGGWRNMVPDLLDIRGVSMNEKYCPWTRLNQLIPDLERRGALFERDGARKGFLSFVKRHDFIVFGVYRILIALVFYFFVI